MGCCQASWNDVENTLFSNPLYDLLTQAMPYNLHKSGASRMDENDTRLRLTQITDPGHFEKLATAVLREEDDHCRRLAHVGVNEEGKTVRSPVDGIVYTSVDDRRHMLAVHHTTCRLKDLRGKWLSDPNSDLHKTLGELRAQRERTPELGATLILTTNKDPAVGLVHEVERAGREAGIEIRVWSGSALAHFLDFEPKGQWIRKTFLGVDPTHLSEELLNELSVRSVRSAPLLDDPEWWVDRDVDEKLRYRVEGHVQFVLGESGVGKTVACLKCLQQHVQAGGFGLVVTDEVLRTSVTVEDAVERTLRNLQPTLAGGAGSEALSLTSENKQFLLVIEDINRSAQPARLVETLAVWSVRATTEKDRRRWRILCPVWPRTIALASSNADKTTNESAIVVTSFGQEEGLAAVKRRRPKVTDLEAEAVASALGFDPLLIALHGDSDAIPDPDSVIYSYIERAIERITASAGTYTAGEYRNALRKLSLEMLKRRRLEPQFADVLEWTIDQRPIGAMLRELSSLREVVRLEETTENQRVVFRHDRVRDHLLADAITDAISRDDLPAPVMCEPYFAEVIGMALTHSGITSAAIDKISEVNPLALFCALRHCSKPHTNPAQYVVKTLKSWAESGAWRDPLNKGLRTAALRVLAECDGPHIKGLCETIGGEVPGVWSLRGRFRNGDLYAGVRLCGLMPPGFGWAGHVELIDHVVKKGGSGFILKLEGVLQCKDLAYAERRGALRLAGFVASPKLAGVLRESWVSDLSRMELLSDYFWASSQCCGDEPVALLEPIVDAWAAMSDEDEDIIGSPRVRFGADEIRWAFRDKVPKQSIGYLLERAKSPELRWPMLVMMNGIDSPDAVEFVVSELAQQDERLEATGGFSPFADTAVREWSGRQLSRSSKGHNVRRGRTPMSAASRERLRELWSCYASGKHVRRWALRFWCATVAGGDISILRTIDTSDEIGTLALFQRLRRGDRMAIPELVEKLNGEHPDYWWQAGRYLWADELTDCLDRALARRADELRDDEGDRTQDLNWILMERLTELPPKTAERLIAEHWAGLRHSACYVMAALHVASPGLLERVAEVVAESDDAKSMFEHLRFCLGLEIDGRSGVTRFAQRDGLLPYLDYLSETHIGILWRACNKNGWFEWRREHLDSRAKATGTRFVDDAAAVKELDRELDREDQLFPMDHWGEQFLETGVSIEHIMDVVASWLSNRRQERALLMAVDVVTRFGKRRHVALLDRHKSAKSRLGREVIQNADFELRLRSLD